MGAWESNEGEKSVVKGECPRVDHPRFFSNWGVDIAQETVDDTTMALPDLDV